MLHLEAELLDVLPLLSLLPIVQEDVGLRRIGGSPDANPIGAPVLHLLVGPHLDAADELLDGLEGPPMAQEQVDEGREPPIIVHHLLGARFASSASARRPSLILLGGNTVLVAPSFDNKTKYLNMCAQDVQTHILSQIVNISK